jgi:hypothetical protein
MKLFMFIDVAIDDIYAVKEGSDPLPCPLNVWVCMMLFDIHLQRAINVVRSGKRPQMSARLPDRTAYMFLENDKQFCENISCDSKSSCIAVLSVSRVVSRV